MLAQTDGPLTLTPQLAAPVAGPRREARAVATLAGSTLTTGRTTPSGPAVDTALGA